jgi:hypothetical protein
MRTLIVLILLSYPLFAQRKFVEKSAYDRLVIIDESNSNYSLIYGRIYKVNLRDRLPNLVLTKEYKSQDSLYGFYKDRIPNWEKIGNRSLNTIVSTIHQNIIDSLINIINNPKGVDSVLPY